MMDDEAAMRQALALAQQAFDAGEVPVGALVVINGKVVATGFNQPIGSLDPSAHAEMVAVRAAARAIGNYRLTGATLYVTVEPCTMCTGLLVHSRIERLVYGAAEPKSGVIASNLQLLEHGPYNHGTEVTGGVLEAECSALMSLFFAERRARRKALREAGKGAGQGC